MKEISQIWTFLGTIPTVIQFFVMGGLIAGSLLAIVNLWRAIRHNMDAVTTEIEELKERMQKIERDIAAIDVSQINGRFDRMEKKIDDLTSLLLKTFTKS